MFRTAAITALVIVGLASTACGGPDRACVPGTAQACTCTSGRSGAQTCNTEGSGFGPCGCDGDPDAGLPPDSAALDGAVAPPGCFPPTVVRLPLRHGIAVGPDDVLHFFGGTPAGSGVERLLRLDPATCDVVEVPFGRTFTFIHEVVPTRSDGGILIAETDVIGYSNDGAVRWSVSAFPSAADGAIRAFPAGGDAVYVYDWSSDQIALVADGAIEWRSMAPPTAGCAFVTPVPLASGGIGLVEECPRTALAEPTSIRLRQWTRDGTEGTALGPWALPTALGRTDSPGAGWPSGGALASGDLVLAGGPESDRIAISQYAMRIDLGAAGEPAWRVRTGADTISARMHAGARDLVIAYGAIQGTLPGGSWGGSNDAFAMRLDAATGALLWAVQLGTGGGDITWDVATTSSGNVWMASVIGPDAEARLVDGDNGMLLESSPPAGCTGPVDFGGTYGAPCRPTQQTSINACAEVSGVAYFYRCDPNTCTFAGAPCPPPGTACAGHVCGAP